MKDHDCVHLKDGTHCRLNLVGDNGGMHMARCPFVYLDNMKQWMCRYGPDIERKEM